MPFNVTRFQSLPELLKLTTFSGTILVILSIGRTEYQPPGTTFIWITALLSLIVDSLYIIILGMELEESLFGKQYSFLKWPLMECTSSILFSITYFISIWLCVNSSAYADSSAFTFAGMLCLINFIQYTFNLFVYVKMWSMENRKAMNIIDPSSMSSYGGSMSPFTDTIDPVFRNPLIVKVLCMMLSLSLLLALASAEPIFGYGISLFIALMSLGTSGFGIAIVASDLQDRVAKLQIFKFISPQFEIKWMHIQYTCSLILASFNFIGSIICGALVSHAYNNYHTYTTATFFSLTLCLAFILDALLVLHIVSLEDQNEKTQIVSRQQYAEL